MGTYIIEIADNRGQNNKNSDDLSASPPQKRCVIEYEKRLDPKATCCWKIPLKSVLFTVAVCESVGVTVNLILVVVAYTSVEQFQNSDQPKTLREFVFDYVIRNPVISLVFSVAGAVLTYLVVCLLLFAVLRNKPHFMIPHMALQMCAIVALLVPCVLYSSYAAGNTAKMSSSENNSMYKIELIFDIVVLEALLLSSALNVCFFFLVVRYYRFLKREQSTEKSSRRAAEIRHCETVSQ